MMTRTGDIRIIGGLHPNLQGMHECTMPNSSMEENENDKKTDDKMEEKHDARNARQQYIRWELLEYFLYRVRLTLD